MQFFCSFCFNCWGKIYFSWVDLQRFASCGMSNTKLKEVVLPTNQPSLCIISCLHPFSLLFHNTHRRYTDDDDTELNTNTSPGFFCCIQIYPKICGVSIVTWKMFPNKKKKKWKTLTQSNIHPTSHNKNVSHDFPMQHAQCLQLLKHYTK